MFPLWDAMETHITQDPTSGSISTSWSSFRTAPESVPVSPEYTLVNQGDVSGTSALTKFYADIVESTYQTNLVDYFENSQVQDNVSQQVIPTTINYNTIYRRVDFGIDNMKVYVPITQNANLPMYIAFRGTQTIYDYYRDLNVVLDYGSSSVLGSFNSEMTTIYNAIKTFIETENRPVTILGHSLGAMYGLNLLHVLHTQEAPNLDHIESQFKCIMFNPLILVNDAVSYFRAAEQQLYSKNNIEIHSIRGDFLSPLLIQAGIGKVYAYDNDSVQTIDTTDFLLGTWLTQLIGVTDRNSYLNDDNHKLSTFGGNTNGLETYKLIDAINQDSQFLASIRMHNKQYVRIIAGGALSEVHTYVFDNLSNNNFDKSFIDYPHADSSHDSNDIENYNWRINRFSEASGYRYHNIISTYNNQKYINFRRSIISQNQSSQPRFRYIVKVGDSVTNGEFLFMLDSSTVYRQTLSNIISDASVELLNVSVSTYFDAVNANPFIQLDVDKYIVDLVLPQADAAYVSNRRSTITYGIGGTYVGQTTPLKVKFKQSLYTSSWPAGGGTSDYYLAKNSRDYMGVTGQWVLNNGNVSSWTGTHIWELELVQVPSVFDSSYPFTGKVYHIKHTIQTSASNDSVAENQYYQGGVNYTFGGPPDSDDRYLEIIAEPSTLNKTVRIWCYRDGDLNWLDAGFDTSLQNQHPDYTPQIDNNLDMGNYGYSVWLPYTTISPNNSTMANWTMFIEP